MGTLNGLAGKIHAENIKRGYWDKPELCKFLLLITSEVVELMEADRKDKHCKHINIGNVNDWEDDLEFYDYYERYIKGTQEEEGADIIIRALDLLAGLEHNIDEHVTAKLRYTRLKGVDPAKKY